MNVFQILKTFQNVLYSNVLYIYSFKLNTFNFLMSQPFKAAEIKMSE